MRYFCTLSDKNYLALGIALYQSLKQHSKEEFKLYYLCLDKETKDRFQSLNYEEVIPISLTDLEKEKDLQDARADRPYNEYCWTLASYFTLWLLENKKISHLSYVDSDIYFYQNPYIIFREI